MPGFKSHGGWTNWREWGHFSQKSMVFLNQIIYNYMIIKFISDIADTFWMQLPSVGCLYQECGTIWSSKRNAYSSSHPIKVPITQPQSGALCKPDQTWSKSSPFTLTLIIFMSVCHVYWVTGYETRMSSLLFWEMWCLNLRHGIIRIKSRRWHQTQFQGPTAHWKSSKSWHPWVFLPKSCLIDQNRG